MLRLTRPTHPIDVSIRLGGSKSISNRQLIINHVLQTGLTMKNLSESDDTKLLQAALHTIATQKSATIDVHHAGSDLRFLTALLAITPGEWILTGSERLKQRPIAPLVNALRDMGANIEYLETTDFPPLKITGKVIDEGDIKMDSSISSQFISALVMIAPSFKMGMRLKLMGEIVSAPYIIMTIDLLEDFGKTAWQNGDIVIVPDIDRVPPKPKVLHVESDWSSASYWYSICALSPGSRISLEILYEESLQADAVLPDLYKKLGVETKFTKDNTVILENRKCNRQSFAFDFTHCPDIAQTVAVTCFGLGITAQLTGLKTLKLKETDRITALKNELEKLGATVKITGQSISIAASSNKDAVSDLATSSPALLIETYNDHRMAMSFAPLTLLGKDLLFVDPGVVSKSYPAFWNDLKNAGFNVNLQS